MSKHIKSVKQVKAGWYIRAYVNCHGNCAVETVLITGVPFMKDWCNDKKLLAFHTPNQWDKEATYYASDLGATGRGTTRLFPFSNKLLLKLEALQGGWNYNVPNKAFTEFIDQRQYSDQEWQWKVEGWQWDIEMDRRMMDSMFDNYDEPQYE